MADWGAFLEGALSGTEKGLLTAVDIKKILADQKRADRYLDIATAQTAEGIKTSKETRLRSKFERIAKLYEAWKSGQPKDKEAMTGYELEAHERGLAIKEGRPTKRVIVEQKFDVAGGAIQTQKDRKLILEVSKFQENMRKIIEGDLGIILGGKASDLVTPITAAETEKEVLLQLDIAKKKLSYMNEGIATNELGEPILDEKGKPIKESVTGLTEGYLKTIGNFLESYSTMQRLKLLSYDAAGMREPAIQAIYDRMIQASQQGGLIEGD